MAERYAIPQQVQRNAKHGLKLRADLKRGGTDVGVNRYFPRHAGDNLSDKKSNGWIAWQLWGGSAAWAWTRGIIRRADAKSKR